MWGIQNVTVVIGTGVVSFNGDTCSVACLPLISTSYCVSGQRKFRDIFPMWIEQYNLTEVLTLLHSVQNCIYFYFYFQKCGTTE